VVSESGEEGQSDLRRLPQSIIEAEESIRHNELETIFVFDRSGRLILAKQGGADNVELDPDEMILLYKQGEIVCHNHPHDDLPIDVSFSPIDIEAACMYELLEIRAIAPGATFSMRPPANGWDQNYWNEILQPTITKFSLLVSELQEDEIEAGTLDEATAARVGWGRVWLLVAAELGLIYQHTELR
jgi:hypothetical protein